MTKSERNVHGTRAMIGILTGLVLAVIAAIMTYFDVAPEKKWLLLVVPALPMAAWGASHLAQH